MNKYSEQELIEELQRVSEEHCGGEAPRTEDIRRYSEISRTAFYSHYEIWKDALKEAGFNNSQRELNEKDLLQEIQRVSKQYCQSDAPTAQEIEKYSKHSISSYYKYFDSWKNALNEAGFKSSPFRERNKISEKKVFNELKSFVECHNDEVPSSKDFVNADTKVSIKLIREHFGGWREGLVEVGVDRIKVFGPNYSKKEIIEAFKKENSKKDDLITRKEFLDTIGLSTYSFRKHFTKWSELVKQVTGKDIFSQRDNYRITKLELEKEYERISEQYCDGKAPRDRDIKKYSKYSSTVYQQRFGGLQKAAEYFKKEKQTFPLSGKKHPNWKGGFDCYYGGSWYHCKKEVRKRDGVSCRVCNENSNVKYGVKPDVHHITPVRYWDIKEEHEEMNHPRNLISLCRSCHRELEGKFKGRNHKEFEKLAKDYLNIECGESQEVKESLFDY